MSSPTESSPADPRLFAGIGFVVTFLAGGTLALGGAVLATAAQPAVAASVAGVVPLHYLAFLLSGTLHVVFLAMLVGTASITALRGGALPRWLAVAGMVIAGIGVLAVLTIAAPALPLGVVAAPIPLGRFLAFGWIVLAVIALRRARRAATPAQPARQAIGEPAATA